MGMITKMMMMMMMMMKQKNRKHCLWITMKEVKEINWLNIPIYRMGNKVQCTISWMSNA